MSFWKPDTSPANGLALINHADIPITLDGGYKVSAGKLGVNKLADPALWRQLDRLAHPWGDGTVDTTFALPNSTRKGWRTRTTALHEDFSQGVSPDKFGLLLQKGSLESNVAVVEDEVDGVRKNVVRITAHSDGTVVQSAAVLQTADLFGSGRYQVKARFPAVKGLVYAVWTFHYEHHFDPLHLPPGQSDPQYIPNVTGWETRVNHEIDIEIPASCSGLCAGGGCVAQFNTMNINAYVVSNNNGAGPGYVNLCVQAPEGRDFVDDTYHTYAIEWHSGEEGCEPRIDFFFDDDYIGTADVFIPSRASRFVFGMWPGGKNWVGNPDEWTGERHAYISEVHVCPFNEDNDAAFPQVYDQPFNHDGLWKSISLPAAIRGLEGKPDTSCPAGGGHSKPAGACTGSSDRNDGCPCGDDHRICGSGCCDYNAAPGVKNGTCAPASTCVGECKAPTGRPFECPCGKWKECGTGCCVQGQCTTTDQCQQQCARLTARPAGCACGHAGECGTGCCNYNATPGWQNGMCAAPSVCQEQCAKNDGHRPIGCACSATDQCDTNCCSPDGLCMLGDSCPTPTACSRDEDRPIGCPCTHSWMCSTQWCGDGGKCRLNG